MTGAVLLCLAAACRDTTSPGPADDRIAFTRLLDGAWDVYAMRPDGSEVTRLGASTSDDLFPAWSPGHRRLAFWSARGPAGVYVTSPDGTETHWVIDVSFDFDFPGKLTWSPNGRRLALSRNDTIYTVNADGTGARALVAGWIPDWSPDGGRIAFVDRSGVWVVNADGGSRSALMPGATDPAWSPDGGQIAYAKFVTGCTLIYIANADGSGERPLTSPTGDPGGVCHSDRGPDWSSDGRRIVFQREYTVSDPDPRAGYDIFTVNADGSELRNLTHLVGASVRPSW